MIVSPKAVVPNWMDELNNCYRDIDNIEVIVWDGKADKRKELVKKVKPHNKPTIVLINYDKARNDKKLLLKCGFNTLILDESQKVKSRKSQVTKAIYMISKRCDYVYLMTGTPISTGYEDYWSQFLIMDPDILGTRWKDFEDRYCVLGGFQGKQIVGYKNRKTLKKLIRNNSFVANKSACLDLPPVTEHKLYCELGPKAMKAYKELDKELITEIEGIGLDLDSQGWTTNKVKDLFNNFINEPNNFNQKDLIALDSALVKTMKLQQITGGFIKNTETDQTMLIDKNKLNLLQEVIEKHKKESIVIFCKFRAEIDTIKQLYPKALELSGKTKDKGKPVRDFQAGKSNIIVVQLRTGSAGINLTKGSTVIFYSWSGSYIDMRQAKDRLDRIGQKNPVNLYYLIARNTIDLTSLELLKHREKLSNKFLK